MFNHDILLIDLEFTGLDPIKHDIVQIAAVLLDKKTLKEKKSFVSFIKPAKWSNWDPESMAIHGIDIKELKKAPSLGSAFKKFHGAFPGKALLANYGGIIDIEFMKSAYKRIKKPLPYDYHYFNIWCLFYPYMAVKGKLNNPFRFTGFRLEDVMKHFKINIPKDRHDALVDCRAEAEAFRRVIKDLRKLK